MRYLRPAESKIVELAWLDERQPDSEIGLVYETTRYPNLVPRAEYRLTINVYGSWGRPAEAKLGLYIDGRGWLAVRVRR